MAVMRPRRISWFWMVLEGGLEKLVERLEDGGLRPSECGAGISSSNMPQ